MSINVFPLSHQAGTIWRHDPSLFALIMIATLSTCAQLERDNTSFQLQSGRKRYIKGGNSDAR